MNLSLAILAASLYLFATLAAWRGPRMTAGTGILLAAPLALHAWLLARIVLLPGAVSIGLDEAFSLFAWQSAFLLWFFSWREPLQILGLALYPMAAIAALVGERWSTGVAEPADWKLALHIMLSLFSAGLLTLAAVQAGALSIQDRLLHRHHQSRLIRALPPLLNMERVLFQLIFMGFFLLSLTLISGALFVNNLKSQHLTHKTVLSFAAWFMFGTLLWGRWRHGWRGRTAIRWALSGYGALILAYFGSKLVLEKILGTHWT
ncbi:MAG TPA: cytochrome c biogenesis protein CcsA [Nevskiaceae bacterium]|nr:cytochrome c biogenesis protein CcsA [Nevskiaceae bacterium]